MPRQLKGVLRAIPVVLGVLAIAGCSKEMPYKLTEASGVVKFGGKPAENIMVRIIPIPANKALEKSCPTSTAVTDGEGEFKLKTVDGRNGVVAGKCFVELIDLEVEPLKSTGDEVDEDRRDKAGSAAAAKTNSSRVPRKYSGGKDRMIVEVKGDDEPIVIDIPG